MSYFNEINGYLSSLKESQANEASMANEMAGKKAQSIEDKFSSINSSIESAGGIMVAGAEGWFKGRKILEKLGRAGKGKSTPSSTGTDITTPQTKSSGMTTQTKDATLGDKPPSVGDSDLTELGSKTINTSASTDGRISVPKQGLKRNDTSTKANNNPAPEADSAGASDGLVGAPLTGSTDAKIVSPLSAEDIENLKAGYARTTFNRGLDPLSSNTIASADTGKNISSLAQDAVSKAPLQPPPPAKPALGTKTTTQTNGSTEGGGGSGGGSGGEVPSSSIKTSLPDGSLPDSGDIDGITSSITNTIKQKGSQILKDGADSLGVDTDAIMGAANTALDGIPIVGEIFGIGTMIAGLARDLGDKGNVNKKANEASSSVVSSARGAVDTANVASSGATTMGSYIA